MSGNNFLGKRQKELNKNNRRFISYSYNLINNLSGAEDFSKKDTTNSIGSMVAHTSGSYYDRSRTTERKPSERKLSLPSTKSKVDTTPALQRAGKKLSGERQTIFHERKNSLNDFHSVMTRHQLGKSGNGLEKSSQPQRTNRYSDPLYEQRSLPPLPLISRRRESEDTGYNGRGTLFSHFSKSQNNLPSSGALGSRKEGVSAIENSEIMQGKLRKNAVCDSTDDSHYQRQFLRVLNKRF